MRTSSTAISVRWSFLSFAFCTLLLTAGCQKIIGLGRPSELNHAESYFRSGQYAKAAELFETYFQSTPSQKIQDRSLFQAALCYLYAKSPVHDSDRGRELLNRLTRDFPQSHWTLYGEIILDFHQALEEIRQANQQLTLTVESYQEQVNSLEMQNKQLTRTLRSLQQERDILEAHLRLRQKRLEVIVQELEETSRQKAALGTELEKLRQELEELKRIDLSRMPGP